MPANILNLPAYTVTNIEETEHDYHINAETKTTPQKCPHCYSDNLVGFGRNEQLVRDLPIHGKRIGIYVDTRRYQCRSCNKTFYERLPDVDGKRMMTSRLVTWLGKQSVKRPFSHLAEEIGISEMTVKNVFNDYINELERTVRFETPQWMGIDEIHIIKKPRCVVSNIENNTIVNVLRDRNKKTVADYLFRLKGRELVKCVAIDMWEPYKDAVREVMPQARIVVDKFHVVRLANECLEVVRKEIRGSLTDKQRRGLMHDRFILLKREANLQGLDLITLESWTKNYPALGAAYRAKEDFFAIYDALETQEAIGMFRRWEAGLHPDIKDAFYPLIRAVNNWMPEIMAYFDHPVTNAYTESLNNLIRVMNRLGRGYSFEALRAKILFTEGVCKIKKPKFQRPVQRAQEMEAFSYFSGMSRMGPSTNSSEREINYGADISTLVRMIEEGLL
ncbi:MAG: ISL3 family transposase [Betaproteobacteria bacterium]|nr:ISL3 family transposase [Betaproteobacteria bacterium]